MMRIFDNHVHLGMIDETKESFRNSLKNAQIDGTMLISPAPGAAAADGHSMSWQERLVVIMEWAKALDEVIPFFWVDATEADIAAQIDAAAKAGIGGFKTICTPYGPKGEVSMRAWAQIAETGRPILFHTGILIGPAKSSEYCRPLHYESLLSVPKLKFCLAHVSWPWCDECIALFAKWHNCALQGATSAQLYIDTSPGTPGVYRRDVLQKLYGCGLPLADKLIFGSDLSNRYDEEKSRYYVQRDRIILSEMGITEEIQEKYFSGNMQNFIK